MKEEWLFPGAIVSVDVETTSALVAEIKRLIDVVGGMALAQPEQEQKYEKRIAPYSTTLSMLLNTAPPQQQAEPVVDCPRCGHVCSQRPWQGLTDEEVQFCAAKHRQLVNAHYDAASDTNVITAAFEATVFYETVEQALKERNHD